MKKDNVYVIAEVGINANGDEEIARQLIAKAAKAGCDAVKFQKRTIGLVYSETELSKPRESPWGDTNRLQKEGLEFSIETYKKLEAYARKLNLDFFVSCWDSNSVSLIEESIQVDYQKVASAMTTNLEFLQRINETNKPVILSVGMCTEQDIETAIQILDNVACIMACTSTYPTKQEEINLRHITTLRQQYPDIPIGFSNHYCGHDACVGAVALGADMIEFHITLDRTMYGSDQAASIERVDALVDGIRAMEIMRGTGEKILFDSEKVVASKLREW